MQYITAMECITTHKNIKEIGGALEKIDIFRTMSLYFHPSPLKILTLFPYEIYVFGMSKTWETFR